MKRVIYLVFLCFFVFTSTSCLFESQAVPVSIQKKNENKENSSGGQLSEEEKVDSKDEGEDPENEDEEPNEECSEGGISDGEDSENKTNQSDENSSEETGLPDDNLSEETNPGNENESPENSDVDDSAVDEPGSEAETSSGNDEQKEESEKEMPEDPPVHREWTFMVYMGADNSLEPYAIQDINEMESGIEKGGSVTVLSLLDRALNYDDSNGNWTGTRLYEIKKDEKGKNAGIESKRIACPDLGIDTENDTELNLASGNTLSFFVDFVKREYESDHYCLVIWGNGGGWRGCVSDESSSFTMNLPELGKSLEGKGLDAVVFDTSFGLSLETLYELKDACRFVAGTPGINSETGLDYEKFFSEFCAGSKSTGSFLEKICSSAESEFYAVSLSNIQGVVDSLNETGKALSKYISSRTVQKQVFEKLLGNGNTYCSGNYPCDLYISLPACIDYFLALNNSEVLTATRKLQSALQKISVTGDQVCPSLFLIPVISRGTAVSRHPESYIFPDGKNSDGIVRCSFVKNASYWVPTGKNMSFMDSLFYRSF